MSFDKNSRVVDIKEKLKSLKLSYQGTRNECLKRLNAYIAEQPVEPALATPAPASSASQEQPAPLAQALASPEAKAKWFGGVES